MKPRNMTGYKYAALLSLPAFLLLNSFTVRADPIINENSNLVTSHINSNTDNIRKAVYDWHQHPENYYPDGLGDYDGNFRLSIVTADRYGGGKRTKLSDTH